MDTDSITDNFKQISSFYSEKEAFNKEQFQSLLCRHAWSIGYIENDKRQYKICRKCGKQKLNRTTHLWERL